MTALMPWEEFIDTYKPVCNYESAPLDGFMFEKYGDEYIRVRDAGYKNIQNVWSLIDTEGRLIAAPGMHLVNLFGFLITEKEWQDETIEVDAD